MHHSRRFFQQILFFAVVIISHAYSAKAQDTLIFSFPASLDSNPRFQKKLAAWRSVVSREIQHDTAAVNAVPLTTILQYLDHERNYYRLLQVRYWLAYHYDQLVPELVIRLRNKQFVGLENYNDLIIWERVRSGHMKNYGSGAVEKDDLFTVAGRANWLLRQFTGESFGYVSVHASPRELARLQQRWIAWFQSHSTTSSIK